MYIEDARPTQGGNKGGDEQPLQDPVPFLNTEVIIPLKYLSNFWRSLGLPLIYCEIELGVSWLRNCVFSEDDDDLSNATFKINSTKIYVHVVTLSIIISNLPAIRWNSWETQIPMEQIESKEHNNGCVIKASQ